MWSIPVCINLEQRFYLPFLFWNRMTIAIALCTCTCCSGDSFNWMSTLFVATPRLPWRCRCDRHTGSALCIEDRRRNIFVAQPINYRVHSTTWFICSLTWMEGEPTTSRQQAKVKEMVSQCHCPVIASIIASSTSSAAIKTAITLAISYY